MAKALMSRVWRSLPLNSDERVRMNGMGCWKRMPFLERITGNPFLVERRLEKMERRG